MSRAAPPGGLAHTRAVQRILALLVRHTLALPSRALRLFAGPPRRNDRGAPLDLQTQALLRLADLARVPKLHELRPVEGRLAQDQNAELVDPWPTPVAEVLDHDFEGPAGRVPVRVHRPRRSDRPMPALVYFHGGGFVIGGFATHDGTCRALAAGGDCVVVSIDYRLAPEHPFPAAVDDALAGFRWVRDHAESLGVDPARVAVGGDSAGGNLAAVVCLLERDAEGAPPAFQLLIYPATDMTRSFPSHRALGGGFFLETPTLDWFLDHYLPPSVDRRDWRASPLFAETLAGLPPALVVTAGFDPLRDEGEAYAARLRDAGVGVVELREPGLVHGFVNMALLKKAARSRAEMGRHLRRALWSR